MRVLAFRRPRVRVLAVATAAFAAFSLTACESGADAGASAPSSEGSHPATAPETTESGSGTEPAGTDKSTDGASGDGKDTAGSANGTGGTGGSGGTGGGDKGASGSGSGSGSDASPVTCTAANTKIVVTSVSRPINHLLVTATNTGKVPCFAYHAPFLRFDDAQAAVPVLDASVPQAVVTLEPGESAYAGVMTAAATGEGEGGRTARKVTVTLAARSGDAGSGASTVTLPSGGVYVDSTHTVTYWQQEMDQALAW
ncbi:DUF4232 domain-containing protein [Streptomyces sp. NPDC002644]